MKKLMNMSMNTFTARKTASDRTKLISHTLDCTLIIYTVICALKISIILWKRKIPAIIKSECVIFKTQSVEYFC